ncbi:MAG: hypothetical protein QME49_06775 [bacterium]|nr:hypothetical protein [bacterium]
MVPYQCLVFSLILLISVKGMAGIIPLTIDAGGKSFTQYPVAVGVPFPEDENCLDSISNLKLSRVATGEEIPFQVHELCKWKNGKIKAALVQFLANPETYKIDYGIGVSNGGMQPQPKVNVMDGSGYVEVDTGVLRFRINKNYGKLFDGIWLNGKKIIENGDMEVIGVDGQSYKSSNYQYIANEVKIEESGPVRSCIMIRGKYIAASSAANDFRYIVRVYAYAGKDFLQMSHTIIDENSTTKRELRLKGYNIQLKHLLPDSVCRLGKEPSGYHEKQVLEECYAYQDDSTSYSGNMGNGTYASGWIDINNGTCGITAAVRYFWQNYPKGFVVNNDMLKIWLYPDSAEENFFGGSGIAKTHKIMLCFNSGVFKQDAVENQVSLFNYNIFPRIPSEWYCNSGVFGKILPEVVGEPTFNLDYDSNNYGYKYFGKTMPSMCVRDNYDDPGVRDLLYYIQESTNKKHFDKGEVRFCHLADMHIIHAEYGGSDEWGNISSRGGCRGYQAGCGVAATDDSCHALVAGAGVYYLLTGDRWAEEVIAKCGQARYDNWVKVPENMSNLLLRVLQEREIGVALWRAVVAYNGTGDKKYLEGMTENVKGLIGNWKRGFWMQHQLSSGPKFLGRGYYWDYMGNTCKYRQDYDMCKIACPWMAAYMFCPLVEYDMLNKYYNFIEPSLVEDMLIGCMEHIVKYTVAEENGRIGFRNEGCMDWFLDYRANRLLYPLIYLRKLSGNQQWDRIMPSLLDKTWGDRVWYHSEGQRMYQEYQNIGVKNVQIETTGSGALITWTEDSVDVVSLVYGTKRFDGNVKEGTLVNVSGNSCNLTNLISGTKYYFQLITNSDKKTWMYAFKTNGVVDTVKIIQIMPTSVTIEWITDFEGDSMVEYVSEDKWILNPGIYSHQSGSSEQTKNHRVFVEGLTRSTGYHFRVRSQGQGYTAVSEDENFPTDGGVSGLNAYPVDDNSAVIAWITWPGPYYLTGPYSNPVQDIELSYGRLESNLSNVLRTRYGDWGVMLRNLLQDTKYYYRLKVNFYNYPSVESKTYSFFTNRASQEPEDHPKLIGDFGRKGQEEPDNIIDFEDLMWFTLYWNAFQKDSQDIRGDIAGSNTTTLGQPPYLAAQPYYLAAQLDKNVDFNDLMVFVRMWNWYNKK